MKKRFRRLLSAALIIALCLAAAPAALAAGPVAYAVEGGNIYFDPATGTVTGADNEITAAAIPQRIGGVAVTAIGDSVFAFCEKLTSLTLPEGVTALGKNSCSVANAELERIVIPASVKSIYEDSIGARRIYFLGDAPQVKTLGPGMDGAEFGKNRVIFRTGDSSGWDAFPWTFCQVEYFAASDIASASATGKCGDRVNWWFNDTSGVLSITGVGDMTDYEENTSPFARLGWGLTSVVIGEGVTSIGAFAFQNCTELETISIPASVSQVGDGAFRLCLRLSELSVAAGGGLVADEYGALYTADMKKLVTFPTGTELFDEGERMYTVPDGVEEIGAYAFYSSRLSAVDLPYSCLHVGDWAFARSRELAHVYSRYVETLGAHAFDGCVVLGMTYCMESLTSIGDSAYENCLTLFKATFYSATKSYGKRLFRNCPGLETIEFYCDALPEGVDWFDDGINLKIRCERGRSGWGETWCGFATQGLDKLDTIPPTRPDFLDVLTGGKGSVTLVWGESEDNLLVDGYVVYRNGAVIAQCDRTVTSYTDSTLKLGETYSYYVTARDSYMNQSASSDMIYVKPGETSNKIYYSVYGAPLGAELPVIVVSPDGTAALKRFKVTELFSEAYLEAELGFGCTYFVCDEDMPFEDVGEADWFYGPVQYAWQAKLFDGMTETSFAPNVRMSRAMVVTVLYRLIGKPELPQDVERDRFSDVESGLWYSDAVAFLSACGVIDGYDDGTFGVNDDVTREQLAVILYRLSELMELEMDAKKSLAPYSDAGSISSWARTAMVWANAEGLITGRTDTVLAPKGTATRAEVATILMRFSFGLLKNV